MMVMNFVWPITALYFGPVALWGYFKSGVKASKQHDDAHKSSENKGKNQQAGNSPSPEQTSLATTHCGAGCTLGDIVGEWLIFGTGLVLAGTEFGTHLLIDFILAWCFGVVFQYFTIVPMRNLSFAQGIVQAMRADTLSIVAFQIGMSIWAVLTYFVFFTTPHLKPEQALFWFMMQIGMIVGFFTSYPVNSWLIKRGWKEKMG